MQWGRREGVGDRWWLRFGERWKIGEVGGSSALTGRRKLSLQNTTALFYSILQFFN